MSEKELVAIEELEKKYFKIVFDIFQKKDNIEYIKKNLEKIKNRSKIIPNYKPVNILQQTWQELMRYILFKSAIQYGWDPALFPASADMCLETADCFLNFDVKTVASYDSDAKGRIQTEPPQVSYRGNKTPIKMVKEGQHQGKTVIYAGPSFPTEIDKKITTTFFLQSSWDERENQVQIVNSTLNLIPNGLLMSRYGDLIDSFKDEGRKSCGCKLSNKDGEMHSDYHLLKKTARFNVGKFKEPKFTKDWSRSEQLPDYN